jgi:hypothetical protein
MGFASLILPDAATDDVEAFRLVVSSLLQPFTERGTGYQHIAQITEFAL